MKSFKWISSIYATVISESSKNNLWVLRVWQVKFSNLDLVHDFQLSSNDVLLGNHFYYQERNWIDSSKNTKFKMVVLMSQRTVLRHTI